MTGPLHLSLDRVFRDSLVNMKLRTFVLLSVAHLLVLGSCLAYVSHQQNIVETLETLGHAEQRSEHTRAGIASRRAGIGRAFAVLTASSYLLSIGALLASRPLRLVSMNLLGLMYLLLFLEAGTHIFGMHFPALGRPGMGGTRGLWVFDETKGWPGAGGDCSELY